MPTRRTRWAVLTAVAWVLIATNLLTWAASYRWLLSVSAVRRARIELSPTRATALEGPWLHCRGGLINLSWFGVEPAPGAIVTRPRFFEQGGWWDSLDVVAIQDRQATKFRWRSLGLGAFEWDRSQSVTGDIRLISVDTRQGILMPAWTPLPPLALVAWFCRRRMLAAARFGPGRCPACGYDLRATPARCPECGREAVVAEPRSV